MTREEAIGYLLGKYVVVHEGNEYEKELNEALDMAIEALQREDDLLKSLESIEPLYDMVDVVRCKDCRYCTEYYDRDGYPYWMCDEWDGGTDADGFCHCGERKGGGNE